MRRRQPHRKVAARSETPCLTSLDQARSAETETDRPLCRFFVLQKGRCRHGSECSYSHSIPDGMSWEEAKQLVPCPFFARGDCRYAEFCQLRHDPRDLLTATTTMTATAKQPCTIATLSSECVTTVEKDSPADHVDEKMVICGICLEDFTNDDTQRRWNARGRFGLLSCCNHTFCFDCLMQWRKEGSQEALERRSCPTCRKHSDYVVPSRTFPSSEEQKEIIVKEYKDKLAGIPCRRFQQTQRLGSCPFGSDCFYAHLDENGNDVKALDSTMQELSRERERLQETRRRRRQRDARMSFLGVVESNMEDIDVLMSFLRLFHVYGYQGSHEIYRSDDDHDDDDEDFSVPFDMAEFSNYVFHVRNTSDGLAADD